MKKTQWTIWAIRSLLEQMFLTEQNCVFDLSVFVTACKSRGSNLRVHFKVRTSVRQSVQWSLQVCSLHPVWPFERFRLRRLMQQHRLTQLSETLLSHLISDDRWVVQLYCDLQKLRYQELPVKWPLVLCKPARRCDVIMRNTWCVSIIKPLLSAQNSFFTLCWWYMKATFCFMTETFVFSELDSYASSTSPLHRENSSFVEKTAGLFW